jgi:pimeloyl-ACP methyl ester carboxylesterase
MKPPLYDFGGSGPVVHVAVANGFPPAVYVPLVAPLTTHYHVVSLPPRALWPGKQPPEQRQDWRGLAEDMLVGLGAYDFTDVIAIGHSFGGIGTILAALAEPERFRAVILLDPTILPPEVMAAMAAAQADGTVVNFPLAQGALRRRRKFASVDEAYAYFRGKSLFNGWPDATVHLYAEEGLRPAADGDGLELAWPPEWEAYYFTTLYTRTWEVVDGLHPPVLTIRGGTSDTFFAESAERLRGLLPEMAYAEIPGHGHLFPQSAPEETGRIIEAWLERL